MNGSKWTIIGLSDSTTQTWPMLRCKALTPCLSVFRGAVPGGLLENFLSPLDEDSGGRVVILARQWHSSQILSQLGRPPLVSGCHVSPVVSSRPFGIFGSPCRFADGCCEGFPRLGPIPPLAMPSGIVGWCSTLALS